MELYQAQQQDARQIWALVGQVIRAVYPLYYHQEAVDFFLEHHTLSAIEGDIQAGGIWLLRVEEKLVGTITAGSGQINRLFVLPEYQGLGYGRVLMDFMERRLFAEYDAIQVAASLPAAEFYRKRGYTYGETHKLPVANGKILYYETMEKHKGGKEDGKLFLSM